MIQGTVRKVWIDKYGRKHLGNTSVSEQIVILNSVTHVRYLVRRKIK
jgi:hypothetical protein